MCLVCDSWNTDRSLTLSTHVIMRNYVEPSSTLPDRSGVTKPSHTHKTERLQQWQAHPAKRTELTFENTISSRVMIVVFRSAESSASAHTEIS